MPFTIKCQGREKGYDEKLSLLALEKDFGIEPEQFIAAMVNNRVRDLNYEVYYDAEVEFLDLRDHEAMKIYEATLRYIVAMAFHNLYPELKIRFAYNVSRCISVHLIDSKMVANTAMLLKINHEVERIVAADYPITRTVVPNEKAAEIYRERGFDDKISLLAYRPEKTVHLNECNGYVDYMYSHLAPSTGYIKDYKIRLYAPGFLVQYPRSECGGKIPPFEDAPTFGRTLKESHDWAKIAGIDTVAKINHEIEHNGSVEFINICEARHNRMLAELGQLIEDDIEDIRLVCIAGPSSSGKTTFANRLRIELLSRGIHPIRISIDDYYKTRGEAPLDESGKPDLESIGALDTELFNQNMLDLINGEEVQLPKFDFKVGHRVPGRKLRVHQDEPIIIEGIHALNDLLTPSISKANKFKITSNNAYWGSVSTSDCVWESSLWAMSLAYASHFLQDELSEAQKTYIYNMIKAECHYELQRSIPTGFSGDTKAEENGWETNILACALGLYPDDALAPQWFARLRQFAINCYSHVDDAHDATVIDPDYGNQTVQDLYIGKNLYDDYTLQNHNYFHTSYQNVVMQELGESHLALHLFQGENPKWKTNALMHNNQKVMNEVLCRLALADGELAMPNGNDWSMFLYDQITSYTTAACFLRDPNALMLENLAYKNIKARQSTTADGSWLLNSDIGPRRMGVEGHRVMMTYLMHELASTADLQPTAWADFSKAHEDAYHFVPQNIVRANTADRFSVFSWSDGLKSYTGYIASNTPDKNTIIVPYKANNTGNILGWYTVSGKTTDASPVINGIYDLNGNSYTMNGKLNTNGNSLENNFTLYSTPGNAVIYMDYVVGKTNGTITEEKGGLMAISTDPFTKTQRTLYHAKGRAQTDGSQLKTFESNWVNIDNEVGIVCTSTGKSVAFGDRELNSSIFLSKIYPAYSNNGRTFSNGSIVDRRHIIYYSNVDSAATALLAACTQSLTEQVAEGWNGIIASDWRREGGTIRWKVTVPPNTTAEAHLPDGTVREIGSGEWEF